MFVICSEQDFQLLEALAKRILSEDKDREEDDEPLVLTASDSDRLNKLRALCKRLKHYQFTDKLLSTMFIQVFYSISILLNDLFCYFVQDKSNELVLPPISKPNRSSLSFDDTHISIQAKKRQRTSDTDSPTGVS